MGTEAIVSGVQIINYKNEDDYDNFSTFYENYKEVKLAFSNGYETQTTLSSAGKANEVTTLEQPVETSFVNVLGVSTFGHMPSEVWPGVYHTGFRGGLSEIRVFGCAEGKPSTQQKFLHSLLLLLLISFILKRRLFVFLIIY